MGENVVTWGRRLLMSTKLQALALALFNGLIIFNVVDITTDQLAYIDATVALVIAVGREVFVGGLHELAASE